MSRAERPGAVRHAPPRPGWPTRPHPGSWQTATSALEGADGIAPAGSDLWGASNVVDSDLDGRAAGDVGALENQGEITGLLVSRPPGGNGWAALVWDPSANPAVLFHVYAADGDPFRLDGGRCLAAFLGATVFEDAEPLAPRGVRFFLVTGHGAAEGARGLRSDGTARPTGPSCAGS